MPDCPTDLGQWYAVPPLFTIYGRLWIACPIADINGAFILAVSAVTVKYEKANGGRRYADSRMNDKRAVGRRHASAACRRVNAGTEKTGNSH